MLKVLVHTQQQYIAVLPILFSYFTTTHMVSFIGEKSSSLLSQQVEIFTATR